MNAFWRRSALAAALSLVAAAGGLLVSGTAQAGKVSSGSVSFSGDSGDFITQGKAYSYSTGSGDGLSTSSTTNKAVQLSISGRNGDWWTIDFYAPSSQSRLSAGTYSGAHRAGFNGTGPGLELSGNGRGCNTLTGSFTVTKAVFGSGGYVQAFDATFEQHCEGGTAAAHGSVHISNPAQPKSASSSAPRSTRTSKPSTAARGSKPSSGGKPSSSSRAGAAPSATPGVPLKGPAFAAVTRNSVLSPLLVLGVVLLIWMALVSFGGAIVGVVMVVRRR
jgi:hypothetical protein